MTATGNHEAMNASQRRIVITGLGAATPLGTGNDAIWQALATGKSGVLPLQAFATDGAVPSLAAEVRDFDAKLYVKQRKSLKVMARDIQLAVGAAQLCVADSGIEVGRVDPTRFGVSCGAGLIATELEELGPPVSLSVNGSRKFDLKRWGKEGMEKLFPLWMLKYLPNMPACHISIFYDAQGPNNSITAGEASSALALGEAFRILTRGKADLILAGGTDSKVHPLSFVRLNLLGRLCRRQHDPATTVRPFDVDRDGLVPGEGSGFMVLEELTHARSRGAKIYAEVMGFGASCVPTDRAEAIRLAVRQALADADLQPSDLGHLVADAPGFGDDDRGDVLALADLLADAPNIPVVGYKGYLGYLGAGGGAVELIASLLAMKHGVLPPTLNYSHSDPDLPAISISREKIDFPLKPFLTYDVSHSGQCGALVVKPFVA